MQRLKIILTGCASLFMSACGSMSFGQTALDTMGVFFEANAIKQCYEDGGSRDYCEGSSW